MTKQIKGTVFILISALMFASYGVFSKYLESYDVFFQTYVRSFLIAAVLLLIGLWRKEFKRIEREDYKWFVVVVGFTLFSIAPIVYAYRFLDLATASFLFYAALTVFTYIFGFAFFAERWTLPKILGLLLSVIGMLLIFAIDFNLTLLIPMLMAAMNGLASSGEVTFSKKISHKYSNTQIVFIIFLSIGITHLLLSLIIGETQDIRIVTESGFTIFSFGLAAIIGMFTVVQGFKYLDPSIAAIVGLMEIVFAPVLGLIFFSEIIGANVIIGGIMIIVAAALPNLRLSRKSNTT